MMTKFFVALNFSSKGLLSRKITGFRKRFDPKYNQYGFPHMSMLAPFEMDEHHLSDLVETLKEEIETFFYGKKYGPRLAFNGIGIYEHHKRNLLYLNAYYDTDLRYCSEMVLDICKSLMSPSFRYKQNKAQFLPLGIFQNINDLSPVLDHAKIEFKHNSEIAIESISLYQKKLGIWCEKETLVNFEVNESRFLQFNNELI